MNNAHYEDTTSETDSLTEMISRELTEMIKVASDYKVMIAQSKTQTKKAYYRKKLTQTVNQVDRVMKAMDAYKARRTTASPDVSEGIATVGAE